MNRFLQVSFWAACFSVAVLSLLPVEHLSAAAFDWWDKAQHALAFLVLGGFGLLAYSTKSGRVVLGLSVYGAIIELVQSATDWRYGDWQDWLADVIGVIVAWFVFRAVEKYSMAKSALAGRRLSD